MYKNQLQELAQRSCFNLPSYACYREGPDHAPRFRASVNFNGEIFESPNYWSTLRQAEHGAAEVALNALSSRCPSRSLTARVLDETGVYKNLLQETAHRAGLNLPVYTTVRSGPGHLPVFTCTVNIASINFTGVSAKTKKQAEKNAAIAAWSGLKRMPYLCSSLSQTNKETGTLEEEDQVVVSRVLSSFKVKDESKLVRRWDQNNRGRRRLVKGHKEWDQMNSFASSSSTSINNNSLHFQQTRPVDLFMDSSTQKQSSFLTSLPPPPPRTTSKILSPISSREIAPPPLYQSNRPLPSELVRVTSQAKLEERPPPPPLMEEHQRDEEEWLGGGKTDILLLKNPIEKEGPSNPNNLSSIYRLFPLLNVGKLDVSVCNGNTNQDGQQTQIRSRLIGPPKPSSMAAAPIKLPTNVHMTRPSIYSGGFNYNPQRIAPAVQIRSVIPVCAAPPPSSNPPPILQEASPSTSASVVPTQTGPDQESLISSKFNKLQL